jgi:hypothetical protein
MVIENLKLLLALEMLFVHCAIFRSIIHSVYLTKNRDLQEHETMELGVSTSDAHSTRNSVDRVPTWLARVCG